MRNKYIAVLFIAFILIITALAIVRLNYNKEQVSIEDSLIKSIESTKAEVMQSSISTWAKINNSFMTEEQVEVEMKALIEIINPDRSTINIMKENSENVNSETLNASAGSRHYNIKVESIKTAKGGETYAIIDVYIDNNCTELTTERQKLDSYYTARNAKPKVSSCIIGVYDGKLAENQMKAEIADAMAAVQAKEVEGLQDDELKSISAFSGNINSFVMSNNKKVNMQIAMRFSSYDDKTYIWIGSPLIHMEY